MHDQAGFFNAIFHILEYLLADVMILQQMAEFQCGV